MSDDRRYTRPLSAVEIELRIQAVIDELESATERFDDLAKHAAEAEADYREAHAICLLEVANTGIKMTVDERNARVDAQTSEEYRVHLITQAARNSAREGLTSMRYHLDALRTLSASVRGQT